MRFVLPIICILTFGLVSVIVVDAVMPLGIALVMFLKDGDAPIAVRLLLLVPFIVTFFSSLAKHTLIRGILTGIGVLLLTGLWLFALLFFVVYPFPDTRGPMKAVPAITSIPFLLAVIATMTHSVRNVLSWRRKMV